MSKFKVHLQDGKTVEHEAEKVATDEGCLILFNKEKVQPVEGNPFDSGTRSILVATYARGYWIACEKL